MQELAVLNPRRGRRHIMDLPHREGWTIGTRLMKRLRRAEGLLVVLAELLSSELFEPLTATRCLVDRRRVHYSRRRPQWALGKLTPAAFAAACPALPPLRFAALACAAASPDTLGAGTMLTLSQGVDR